MTDLARGRVQANGITFEYMEAGEGPLALCMHGFPDTPYTYRHLLPALAEAGFRAVAPFVRGFAPTELPPLRHHVHTSVMVADQIALTRALGGGPDALLVAHDWGAVGAWGALNRASELWGRSVVINIPPFEIFGENLATYAQIKRSFYFWYFQMQRVIEDRIRQDDFALISSEDENRKEVNKGIECIGCAVCYSSCDVVSLNPEYLGPAALNRAWTLVKDERDVQSAARLRAVAGDAGCHSCHTHMSCTEHCPKQISPTAAIAGLKREVTRAVLKGTL